MVQEPRNELQDYLQVSIIKPVTGCALTFAFRLSTATSRWWLGYPSSSGGYLWSDDLDEAPRIPAEKMRVKRRKSKREVRGDALEGLGGDAIELVPDVREVKHAYDIADSLEKLRTGNDESLLSKIRG